MIRINENYLKLKASYLFADIAKRVNAYVAANPDKPLIRLGIGDVTEPLPEVCVTALHEGADEMSKRETFRGYGPEQGYAFLREAIAKGDYESRGCPISAGAWVYSRHESTRVWCAVFVFDGPDGRREFRWRPGRSLPERVSLWLLSDRPVIAHNVSFERSVWDNVLEPLGVPGVPHERWRDSQTLFCR